MVPLNGTDLQILTCPTFSSSWASFCQDDKMPPSCHSRENFFQQMRIVPESRPIGTSLKKMRFRQYGIHSIFFTLWETLKSRRPFEPGQAERGHSKKKCLKAICKRQSVFCGPWAISFFFHPELFSFNACVNSGFSRRSGRLVDSSVLSSSVIRPS